MKKTILATTIFLLSAVTTLAATSTAGLQLSVTIRPYLKFATEQHVHIYTITNEDITRGYIDLPATASISVRSNERRPIAISVVGGENETILVRPQGEDFLPAGAPLVLVSHSPGVVLTKQIDCRIVLSRGAECGEKRLNLVLSPQAL